MPHTPSCPGQGFQSFSFHLWLPLWFQLTFTDLTEKGCFPPLGSFSVTQMTAAPRDFRHCQGFSHPLSAPSSRPTVWLQGHPYPITTPKGKPQGRQLILSRTKTSQPSAAEPLPSSCSCHPPPHAVGSSPCRCPQLPTSSKHLA